MKQFACFVAFAVLLLCSSAAVVSESLSIDESVRSYKKHAIGKKPFRSGINTRKAASGVLPRGKLAKKKRTGKPISSISPVKKAAERKKLLRPLLSKKGTKTNKALSKLGKKKSMRKRASGPAKKLPLGRKVMGIKSGKPKKLPFGKKAAGIKSGKPKKLPFGKKAMGIKSGKPKGIKANKVLPKLSKKKMVRKTESGPKPSKMNDAAKKLPLPMKPMDTKPGN